MDLEERTEIRIEGEEVYPCLEIIMGPRVGSRFPLKEGKNLIGRSSENDIVLDDSSVSRRHAMIEVAANGAVISDLGSRNGTKVTGKKIQTAVSLSHQNQVKVGVYHFRFLTGPAEPMVLEGSQEPSEVVERPPEQGAGGGTGEIVEEGGEAPLEPPEGPPPEGVVSVQQGGGRKRRSWILYGALGVVLVAALIFGLPPLLKKGGKKETDKKKPKEKEKTIQISEVIPASPLKITPKPSEAQPIFLDFSSTPIPTQVFFGNQMMGTTPFRISTNLRYGRWYEIRALFPLPEVGEVIEEKQQLSPPQGASVMPVNFSARIGIIKVAGLPRNAQLYLEGYFEKDPYRAKPIKFAEIIFGKPVYVPYGRYIIELRQSRQIANSQTFLDEVVYRREFFINPQQTTYTIQVTDDDITKFPVEISSLPPEAKVFVDEKEVGKTPYKGMFPIGEHLLALKKEGYFDYVQVVKMGLNMPYVAEIPLQTSAAGEVINKADLLMKEDRFVEALPVLVEAFSKNPSPRETAQISHLVGVCYLRQRSYQEAMNYFLKSMQHEEYKYPARLGIASTYFEQGDSTKALQLLVEVLVSSEDPNVRAEAGSLFQRISPLKSVLYITSEPYGARVFINNVEVAQKTPLILHDLGVGSYRVQVKKEGYHNTEVKLNLGVSEFRPVVAKLRRIGE